MNRFNRFFQPQELKYSDRLLLTPSAITLQSNFGECHLNGLHTTALVT